MAYFFNLIGPIAGRLVRPIPPDIFDDPHQQRGYDFIGQFAVQQIQVVGSLKHWNIRPEGIDPDAIFK